MLTVEQSDDWWGARILLKPRRSFRPGSPLSLECPWQPCDVSSVSRRSPWLSGFEGMPTEEGKHHCVTHFSVLFTSKNEKFTLFIARVIRLFSLLTVTVTLTQTNKVNWKADVPSISPSVPVFASIWRRTRTPCSVVLWETVWKQQTTCPP